MIDWITMKLQCDHEGMICNGSVVKVSKDNDIEWTSTSWLPVVGSHDSSIVIRSISTSSIEISGNPTKWLQGHNLFGTNDLKRLVWLFFNELMAKTPELNLKPSIQQLKAIKDGFYTLSRVDINETWLLNNRKEVLAWINAAGHKMRLKHRGAGQFKGDTLYWGKGSKRWFLKCYSKGDEINSRKSNYPAALRTPDMLDYAERSLRFEMTIKSNYLRESLLHHGFNWNEDTAIMLLVTNLRKLEMSNNFKLLAEDLEGLPTGMKTAYYSWFHGVDVKAILPPRTFYKYRKVLKGFDIDIGILRDTEKEDTKVIPLMRILEAQPAGIPSWAYEQGLVAC